MKIKKSTVFLLLAALALGGITVLTVQTQQPSSEQTAEGEPQDLFAFQEAQVQSFTLENRSESFRFERNEEGQWQMLEPEQQRASDASIAFLLNQMAAAESTRSITISANERSDFGLDDPLATVDVTLDNQETHRLVLGGYDFNRSFLYALVDPAADENADLQVFLVSPNFENAVIRPREDWKATEETSPESSPTPSPDASPSSTESAAPEASPSPLPSEVEASPSPTDPASPANSE
ncbi:DUF4340 domain-containing protein [Thermocoleostomius sinensis]|uniref:DUF4340 domain-containing protein n=1 Tax=Thermocoleostomius sinensis A174 TaxID=2016057 RepID=A0A9E9C659_9CYAN|nr:DUF4340 domain-containing protein [Thermocoleostomius sinensis]WAL61921.1 DUF4340 domain-containing protein [Thermocoleostomius sinensis A174]